MNDIEFINSFDKKLGEFYSKSKSYCNDTPTHSLIILRSFVVKFIEILATKHKIDLPKTYLYKKIEQLSIVKKIDNDIISNLHLIRIDSNQGAHFEKSNLTLDEFVSLAKTNLQRACLVVSLLYKDITNKEIPNYKVDEASINISQEMCYKAVMQDDINAQYSIGLNLQAKAKLEHQKEYQELKHSGQKYIYNPNSLKLLEKSAYWFKQASSLQEHPEALYEYAMCLLYGEGIEQNIKEGEQLVEIAANKNSINAKAIFGAFYLEGSTLYKKDYQKALFYLKDAANEDHPEALTNLSYMYKDAIGVKEDLSVSFNYMQKAAHAGYSYAQYHLSNFYFNGIGTKKDNNNAMLWLDKSLEKEYPLSILTKARLLLQGDVLEQDLLLSEELYIKYIEFENDYNVLYELAKYYYEGLYGNKDLNVIYNLLIQCYENSDNEELKEQAYSLSLKVKTTIN